MKPLNLQEALAGKKVVTRDGREVTQLTNFTGITEGYPLGGVLNGDIATWTIDGEFLGARKGDGRDLFMASEKKRGWVNVYRFTEEISHCSRIYPCEQEALKHKGSDSFGPVEISWEE